MISRRLEHPAKALSPIYFKISGKRIDFSIRHEEKALRPIPVTLSGSSIFSRRVPQKAYVPIYSQLGNESSFTHSFCHEATGNYMNLHAKVRGDLPKKCIKVGVKLTNPFR